MAKTQKKSWLDKTLDVLRAYTTPHMLRILTLGFASGLPMLLTMSTLSWWFSKVGVSKESIGLFALSTVPYSLKPLWAPLTDHMKLPFLHLLGRRRSWLLMAQFFLCLSILGLGWSNPQEKLWLAGVMSFMVTFWSSTQDIVIDAYRIETLAPQEQAMGGVVVICGYRLAMLTSGAGALYLSEIVNWEIVYSIMAAIVILCMIITLAMPEPEHHQNVVKHKTAMDWLIHSFWHPLKDFVVRPNWFPILLFILLYQAGDHLMSRMSMPFYNAMGFTGNEIATASKSVGLIVTIIGSFVGGALAIRLSIFNLLFWAGGIHALTNIMLSIVALKGHSMPWLYAAIISENFSFGIISAAFVGFLSQLCTKEFSATQYALFSSLTAAVRIALQSASGYIANEVSWHTFFLICVGAAIPGLLVLAYLKTRNIIIK